MKSTRPDVRRIVAVFRVLIALPAMSYAGVLAFATLWFGFQRGMLDAIIRLAAIPTFAVLPFIPFSILPHRWGRIGIPFLCGIVGLHALLSQPSDFSLNDRILYGLWTTVPMATLIVDALLTSQTKETIEPASGRVSSKAAANGGL